MIDIATSLVLLDWRCFLPNCGLGRSPHARRIHAHACVDQGWHLGCRAHRVCNGPAGVPNRFCSQGSRHCCLYHHNRPIGSHLLGRAAFRADTKVFQATTEDDEVARFRDPD